MLKVWDDEDYEIQGYHSMGTYAVSRLREDLRELA